MLDKTFRRFVLQLPMLYLDPTTTVLLYSNSEWCCSRRWYGDSSTHPWRSSILPSLCRNGPAWWNLQYDPYRRLKVSSNWLFAAKSKAIAVVSHKNIKGEIYQPFAYWYFSFDVNAMLRQKLATKMVLWCCNFPNFIYAEKSNLKKVAALVNVDRSIVIAIKRQ